mgnify:CR=1 FL=1
MRRLLCVFPRYTPSFGSFEFSYPLTDGIRAFIDREYTPGRMVLAAAGAVEHERVVEAAAAALPALMLSAERLAAADHLTGAADQYQLACTAFELLTGAPPYPGTNLVQVLHQHLNSPPPSPRSRHCSPRSAACGGSGGDCCDRPVDSRPTSYG